MAGTTFASGPSRARLDRWSRPDAPRRARAGVRAKRRAHKGHRLLRSRKQRRRLIAATDRHALGRCKVIGNSLQGDPDLLAALNAIETAIPVRKPLRGEIGKRRKHEPHQRQRHEGFDQRKAALVRSLLRRHPHCCCPCIRRTVLTSITAPEGERTWILTRAGIQAASSPGALPFLAHRTDVDLPLMAVGPSRPGPEARSPRAAARSPPSPNALSASASHAAPASERRARSSTSPIRSPRSRRPRPQAQPAPL